MLVPEPKLPGSVQSVGCGVLCWRGLGFGPSGFQVPNNHVLF